MADRTVGTFGREAGSPAEREPVLPTPNPPYTSEEDSNRLRPQQPNDEASEKISEKSSVSPPAIESVANKRRQSTVSFESDSQRPGPSDITTGIRLYFDYCHRQPIWCFERDEIKDAGSVPEHLVCSILALTARFSHRKEALQRYGSSARQLIMHCVVNGTVDITVLESLCLLSYSSFIDGNTQMGQFYLGLGVQLCRSALMDVDSVYSIDNPVIERRKRFFWSLQVLEQYYGRQTGLLSVPTEMLRPPYAEPKHCSSSDIEHRAPPLPRDDLGHSSGASVDPGVWNTSVHLGWVWSRVRKYVSDCAYGIFKEPWRRDSMYAMVLSDFMETENRIPMCHRYDTVKFYERKIDELKANRDYWATWLKEQFTYHAIHTVLNHPFLYIIGAQHNPNLAIPNTFWRRSSELALLHSTWIVRLIDMVLDKQVHLIDPFFGHIAAIAATVHLYYCCAAAARLKHKSNTDFAKCRRFLKSFIPFSSACAVLDSNLDKMTRIAAGSESVDVEDWMPSRIYLSVSLMWDILQFNCTASQKPTLLDPSLCASDTNMGTDDLLEIIVATSPEIVINTADGGQEAPTLPYKAAAAAISADAQSSAEGASFNETGALTLNTTPWLYEDTLPFINMEDVNVEDGDTRMAWWEGDFPGMYDFAQ